MDSIRSYFDSLRDYLEDEFGIPTYTERLPDITNDLDCCIYQDDSNAWMIDKKEFQMNFIVATRYELDNLSNPDPYFESDAADHAKSIIQRLLGNAISGVNLDFNSTQMAYDKQGRFIFISKFTAH